MDKVITNGNIINLIERGKTSIVSASLSKGIMTDDTATYRVLSAFPLDIKINSTINIFGKTYRVNNKPEWSKTAENSYSYDIKFEGILFDLRKCMLFNADDTGFKTDSDFSLIGTIEVFLLCIKNNIKRLSPNWVIGTFENKETKTINFSKDNCLSALQKICQEFKVEFRIDDANNFHVINVGNFGKELDYTFEYGKGKGLYELSCTNVDENGIINRMYVAGGSENLPTNYRNFSNNLKLPNGLDYIEDSSSIVFIGLKEGFIDFPDIYPHRTGKISAIDSNKKIFFDDSMDFDLNAKESDGITTKYLKADATAKVHFNTGNLAGYEFEIKPKTGYDHATKRFEIIPFKNESELVFPSETAAAFQFQVGDEYVILDIYYPEIYVTNAENELLEKADEQFPLNLQPKVNYKLKVDENYLKNKVDFPEEVPFDLGDTVTIIDNILAVNKKIKIVSFNRDILNPFSYEIEIADSYEINFASQIILDIIGINNTVTSQSNVITQNYLNGYRRLNELQALTFDSDGYFDSTRIKPLSIETNMLSVGSRSQQLTLEGITIEPNHDSDENAIKFSEGKLIHFSMGDEIIEWNFLETIINGFDSNIAYYVYAKCQKNGIQGEFFVSADKIKFDELPTFYYFLLGVMHKANNGFRFYTPLEGATMINGRFITTGKIQSVDNSTWFDLDLAAFILDNYAGMTGKGSLSDYFLWAGADYANRQIAPFGVTKEGLLVFRNNAGVKVFELGLKSGKVVFNIFDELTGTLIATIGAQGIMFQGYVAESYNTLLLRILDNPTDDTNLKKINRAKSYVGRFNNANDPIDKIRLIGNITSYQYSAGYNFESAMNSTYEGKVFDSANKLGSFIPDGYYVYDINFDVPNSSPPVGYIVNIVSIINGVIVESFSGSGTI